MYSKNITAFINININFSRSLLREHEILIQNFLMKLLTFLNTQKKSIFITFTTQDKFYPFILSHFLQ